MNTEYSWKTGWFGSNWKIFRNYKPVGFIQTLFFSKKATAEIDGKKYEFRDSKWISLGETEIFDASGQAIGQMKGVAYEEQNLENNVLAAIRVNGEVSFLEMPSTKKWFIHNPAGLHISYKPTTWTSLRGQIVSNKDNRVEVLFGLYIFSIFSRLTKVILAGIAALIGVFLIPGAAIFLWQLLRKLFLGF